MCGIFGLIGKPPEEAKPVVYGLLTALAVGTQTRGTHATGYAGFDETGRMVAAKAPLSAEQFVQTSDWTRFEADEIPSFFIGHCRWATHGSPAKNENNHPFLSQDGTKALIHNGVVSNHYQIARESNLNLVSECDSEVILRMIEHENTNMKGIKSVFSKVFYGFSRDGAVAMLDAGEKKAFLFRSQGKPCHAIRVPVLGNALVFASTESILKDALAAVGLTTTEKGWDLKPYRIYEIAFGSEEGPTITTTDITFKTYKPADFWSNMLQAPAVVTHRSYTIGNTRESTQGTLFDDEPDWPGTKAAGYDLEEVRCPCGNVMFMFKTERRECGKCHQYLLGYNEPAKALPKRFDTDTQWLTLHCETCGITFQQQSIHKVKCIKCGGSWVTLVSASVKPGRQIESRITGIWKCTKCGVNYIANANPGSCRCGGKEFAWEGEVTEKQKKSIEPRTSGHKCQDCDTPLGKTGWTRCSACHEKRKEGLKKFPWRCDKCGKRVANDVKLCPGCGGEIFTKMK